MNAKSLNKTVLVAMTGRMDSTVAAYLLKKQGYTVIGVSFVLLDGELVEEDIIPHYHIPDLEEVGKICQNLEITFYAVNLCDEFRSEVINKAVSLRATGEQISPSAITTKLMFDSLYQKMESLKADHIATGHYAKVLFNHSSSTFSLLSANDTDADQSYDLSLVEKSHFAKLMLPLSDIRQYEVERISKMMGCPVLPNNRGPENIDSFLKSESFRKFVTKKLPYSMIRKGPLIDYVEDVYLTDHEGVHNFFVGQSRITTETMNLDSTFRVETISYGKGIVFVKRGQESNTNYIFINNFDCDLKFNRSVPIDAYVKLNTSADLLKCSVFFKNNNCALIKLEETLKEFIGPGTCAVLYNKKGVGARVLGPGNVFRVGQFAQLERVIIDDDVEEFNSDDDDETKALEEEKKRLANEIKF